MNMQFTDTASLSGTRETQDGYLVTEAFAVRTGIQLYAGSEVGLIDRDVVRVYRSEDEVRNPASLATFAHAPVTLGHPVENVTKDNWADLAKGEVSTEATWDGNKIKLPLIVKDADAIAAIDAGTRELSAGYTCELEFIDGVTPEGEAYDARQVNIRVNHLAIVPKGRAGAECRIGDNANNWGVSPVTPSAKGKDIMSDALITVVLGDKAVSVTAADKATIELFKAGAAKTLADAETAHAEAIDAKDAELATKDAEIKKLTDAALSDSDLDAKVQARGDLIDTAKTIAKDLDTKGLSDADIRRAAIIAVDGEESVKDKSAAYIDAMFDIKANDAAKVADVDPLSVVDNDTKPKLVSLDQAYADRDAALADAWKTPAKEA